jgi:hypothetical protein
VLVPVKLRQAKDRRPQFSDETLLLFRALSATPQSMRKDDDFQRSERRLHDLLGLDVEYLCTGGHSVLDTDERPPCKSATSTAKPSKATAHQKKPKKGWSDQLPSQTNGAPPNWSITPSPTFPRPSQFGTGRTVP